MRPGSQESTLLLESDDEIIQVLDALIDFCLKRSIYPLENKLDKSNPPVELNPDETKLVLSSLKLAAGHHTTPDDIKQRINKMLDGYLVANR